MIDTQITTLAQQIAAHLEGWSYQPPREDHDLEHVGYLVRDEMKISIKRDWRNKERVNINTWAWPTYTENPNGKGANEKRLSPSDLYDPKESSPSISVAIARGAEVIAREIARRFLPDYERIYGRLVAKAMEHQKYANETRDHWAEICRVLGKTASHHLHYVDIGRAHFSIQQNGNSARLQMDLKPNELAAIVAALKGVK